MISPMLENLDAKLRDIPPLPDAVQEAMAILDQPDVDLRLLERTLCKDPTLVTQVLRVANSPFYGLTRRISSIHDACLLLGIYTVRNVVLTAAVMARFPADGGNLIDRKTLWEHAMGTAVAAKVIATQCGFDHELAFTGGLLHDIGKWVLDGYFPEETVAILDYRNQHDCLMREAEIHVLGFDHNAVGAWVAHHWKLPTALQHAIEFHHTPDEGDDALIADIVHVADVLSRGLEIGNGGDTLIPALMPGAVERVRLDWNTLPELLSDIEELQAAANLMSG